MVHDYLPAINGAGEAVVYDGIAKRVLRPTTNGFSADFGTVRQKFFCADTVAEGMPVRLPESDVEETFVFARDGQVTMKFAVAEVCFTRYDAQGNVLSMTKAAEVAAGTIIPIVLDGAAKTVVTLVNPAYPSEKGVKQCFEAVDVLGVAPSVCRKTGKHSVELIIAGAVTLTANLQLSDVVAEDYDADGELVGSVPLAGTLPVGQTLDVAAGAAARRVVKFFDPRPGAVLFVR